MENDKVGFHFFQRSELKEEPINYKKLAAAREEEIKDLRACIKIHEDKIKDQATENLSLREYSLKAIERLNEETEKPDYKKIETAEVEQLKDRIHKVIEEKEFWEKKYTALKKMMMFYKRSVKFLCDGLEDLD